MRIAIFVVLVCLVVEITGESCDGSHMTLPHLDERASNYSGERFGLWVFDHDLVDGWYDVGRRNIPTDHSILRIYWNSCNTGAPIWMNGTIPSTSEGKVTRTVCIKTTYTICLTPFEIEVINCGTHMLYKLSRVYWTDVAYCFDVWDLSTETLKVQPLLFFADRIGINDQIYKKPILMFRCHMNANLTDDQYYLVSWYVDDIFLLRKGPILLKDIDDTNLYEPELTTRGYKLDINIKCIMESNNSGENETSNSTSSLKFWLGIRVLNPSVNIIQGRSTTMQLQPTFPFGCSSRVGYRNPSDKCLMYVNMFDPDDSNDCKSSSISVTGSQKCGVQIAGFYYDQWTDGIPYDNVTQMTITTRDPNDYHQGRNKFVLKLLTEGHHLNDIVQMSYINIIVTTSYETAWQAKTCYSYVDPHMRSFDGRYYENQNLGAFVLYRHKSRKQEVQMKTKQCNGVATCACAVAVRGGGDIFLIDLCRSPVLINHVSCKDNILNVRQINAYSYKIYMPLGTIVAVAINNWPGYESTLNLNIYPSVKDINETKGLCGELNDDPNDDFMTPSGSIERDNNVFSKSWSISHEQSFFDPKNHNPDEWDEDALLCVCPAALNTTTTPSTASGSPLDPLCSADIYLSCKTEEGFQGKPYKTCNIRTKRSKQSMSKEIKRILTRKVIDDDIKAHNLEKRSILDITFDEALEECTRFFAYNCTTSLFENSLPNSNSNSKNSSITNCALDYTYTGNMSLASLHCETFRSEVDEEIRRNSTFREANPDVVESFRATTCINNCNNHGYCVNGSCICHASYIEEDCSVSLSNYPVVEDTYAGGLCEKDIDECCVEIPIYGSRFVKGITKQKLETFHIYLDGTKVFEEQMVETITILNPFEAQINVPCHRRSQRSTGSDNSSTPFVTGTRVSLTNDGTNYGPAKSYYVFDSRCQGILNDSNGYTFYLKDGACFISGTCYSEREQDTLDPCRRCQPTLNRFSWTYECTISTDPQVVNDMTTVIISVCIGTLVTVFVIITITIIKCCLKKEKRIAGHIELNVTVPTTGPRTLNKNLLFCGQQSLRENEINQMENTEESKNPAKNNRPGTPGSMSFEKIFGLPVSKWSKALSVTDHCDLTSLCVCSSLGYSEGGYVRKFACSFS
ncbi:hypothetical protein CHS0354_011411 [Potamilus streckersoni]|uniref:VWFD domain-containing protein n=1 Tax=Potamilus streckersoni TaxID=2493646 RepID=A0AAE0WDU1_9BIVA|nr:hypothetical protein CHS0354_011411 [Potamilus streckersoni]